MTAEVDYRERGPKIGAVFPDVRLPDQRGELVDLHAYRRGRRAVVAFNRSAVW
jgi:peroxiredoxin